MDSSSGADFCLLCRSALPTSGSLEWYTHHLENVHTVYFHVELFTALTFVSDDKIEKLTSYIKSISNIRAVDSDKNGNSAQDIGNNEKSDASAAIDNYNRVNPGVKRKSVDEAESRPSKIKKDEEKIETETVALYCGPFRCTECGWESDLTRNAVADSALKHWNEVHGNVLKMELEDVPTEELVTLEELFKFVVACSLPECLAVYGSGTNRNDCLLKIKLHWITQHRNVTQISDDFKHNYLVDSEPPRSYDYNKISETIEVDEEDNEVANLMEKIDQIKKDLNNEKNKATSSDGFDNEVVKTKVVAGDFGKSGMTCYDCGQANLNKRTFLQHWNLNHFHKDIYDFKLVCNDTKMKVAAISLLKYLCKCTEAGCGTYIGVNHSQRVLEGAVKDHYSISHGKLLSEINTPDHYISLGSNSTEINLEKGSQNTVKADEDKSSLKNVSLLPVDCLVDGCKSTDIPKYFRHFREKHKGVPVDQIRVKSVSTSKILGPSDLFTWVLQCGAPNCDAIKTSVQRNNKIRDEFKKHWNNNHMELRQNYIFKTLISPSNSSVLDIAPQKVSKSHTPPSMSPQELKSFTFPTSPVETFSNGMICTLCRRPTRTALVHWRSNHPDHPVTSLRMRRLEDDKIMNLRDVYSDNILKCTTQQCDFISVANKGRPVSDAKKRMKKHMEDVHTDGYLEAYVEEVGSLGYVCMVEGCQVSLNRRDEVVEHHGKSHGNLTEIEVREVDTDQKKGLVELYMAVKKCGWECGKIFYSDSAQVIARQVEKHTEEAHLGIHGIEPIELKKLNIGDDAKERETPLSMTDLKTDIQEQLPEAIYSSNIGVEELAEEELEELDEQDELDKNLSENEASQDEDEDDLFEEELEELDENDELEELEKQISANKAKQEMLAVKALEEISTYNESNGQINKNEKIDANEQSNDGELVIPEVETDNENIDNYEKLGGQIVVEKLGGQIVVSESKQTKLVNEVQDDLNKNEIKSPDKTSQEKLLEEELDELDEHDDELEDLDEDLDEQEEELDEQNGSDED